MKKNSVLATAIGAALLVSGIISVCLSREAALAENASAGSTMLFSLSLITSLIGLVITIAAFLPERRSVNVRTMVTAALFAALCYIGFTFAKIDIPVGTEKTAFHLGNVFCVLAALFLGGFWGGMSGAVGMTIADLTTAYVTSAPKTFILKLGIGLITGFVAHSVFQLSKDKARKIPLPVATVLSCAAGMLFNVIADPLVGYFYKMYVLGVPQEAASIWVKIGAVTTSVNAVIAVIAASVFYLALRTPLKRTKLMPEL